MTSVFFTESLCFPWYLQLLQVQVSSQFDFSIRQILQNYGNEKIVFRHIESRGYEKTGKVMVFLGILWQCLCVKWPTVCWLVNENTSRMYLMITLRKNERLLVKCKSLNTHHESECFRYSVWDSSAGACSETTCDGKFVEKTFHSSKFPSLL